MTAHNGVEPSKDNNTKDKVEAAAAARATYNELRSEVSNFMQNPKLKENNISEADVFVSFKVKEDNTIDLTRIESESPYLRQFVRNQIKEKLLSTNNLVKDQPYNLRISFILE